MSPGKHILLICSRLDTPGGIERATINTARLFSDNGHLVTVLVADEEGISKSYYALPEKVHFTWLPFSFGISRNGNFISRKIKFLRDLLSLRRFINTIRPDTIISTEYQFAIATVLCGAGKKAQCCSWEHHHYDWLKKNRFWSLLQKKFYRRLNCIICLNPSEADYFSRYTRTVVIPNFIEQIRVQRTAASAKQLLSAGWLIKRKGTDLLLETAAAVLPAHPDWTWKLIGDGELKPMAEKFIAEHQLQGRLILQTPGATAINNEYEQSSLFILTSRYEAFPMVLLEAMSYGIPCISFDCPSGPSDIISDKADGLLVENGNVTEMIRAINLLIVKEELRREMGQNAARNINRFSPAAIYPLWKSLFDNMTGSY